jgi:hypothetical protein
MAHSDTLIFLTNVTWVFLSFFFVYLFLVVVFLPAFYKRFRLRFFFKYNNEFLSILRLIILFDAVCILGYFFRYYIGLLRGVLGLSSRIFFFSDRCSNIFFYFPLDFRVSGFNVNFLIRLVKYEGLV